MFGVWYSIRGPKRLSHVGSVGLWRLLLKFHNLIAMKCKLCWMLQDTVDSAVDGLLVRYCLGILGHLLAPMVIRLKVCIQRWSGIISFIKKE